MAAVSKFFLRCLDGVMDSSDTDIQLEWTATWDGDVLAPTEGVVDVADVAGTVLRYMYSVELRANCC